VDAPPEPQKTTEHPLANVTSEQLQNLLASDFKRTAARPLKPPSPWRRIFWSAVILLAGIGYVTLRYSTTPSTVIVINVSGEDAASVVLESGGQRVDLGPVANGEIRKVEMGTGHPLRIEYTFEKHRVWTRDEPLSAFEALTVSIGREGHVNVMRETPWSQAKQGSR